MKKIFIIFFLNLFFISIFANGIEGCWKMNDNGVVIVNIKRYEQDNSLYKIVFLNNNRACSYIEYKKMETWNDGNNKKYRLYAKPNSLYYDYGEEIELNFAITKSETGIMSLNANNKSYILTRFSNQNSNSSFGNHSLRDIASRNKTSTQKTSYSAPASNTSSNTYTQPVETRIQNISVTFGLNGNWTFRFYQTGSFECRTWYGQHGKWDTSYMRDFQTTSGTYYITKNQYGGVIVHLRFANGKNTTGSLLYKNGRAEFSYGGTYNMKCHKEI